MANPYSGTDSESGAIKVNVIDRSKKFHSVTSVRGFAALIVCWYHIGLWTNLLPDGLMRYSAGFGWLGPHIFFIVSGFVVPWSMYVTSYRIRYAFYFIARRLVRLDPPYLATALLVIFLIMIGEVAGVTKVSFDFDALQFFSHLGYLTEIIGRDWYNPVFWTLAIEFQYYLLLTLLYPLLSSENRYVRRMLLIISLVVFLPFLGGSQTTWIFGYLPLFVLGFLLFQKYAGLIGEKEFWWCVAPTIILLLSFTPVLVFLSTLVVIVLYQNRLRSRSAEFLGEISYSLYLIHMPIAIPFVRIAADFANQDWHYAVIALTGLTISIVAAWIFHRLIEVPSINLAKRISWKSSTVVNQNGVIPAHQSI